MRLIAAWAALVVAGGTGGARADVVWCGLGAAAEGPNVRLSLSVGPSASGMIPYGCPGTSRLLRSVDDDSVEVVADWPNECGSSTGSGPTCDCGEWVDACVPAGTVEYEMLDRCGSGWTTPRADVVVIETCDADGPEPQDAADEDATAADADADGSPEADGGDAAAHAGGGGCECSASASPTVTLGLPLLAVFLLLGGIAFRRDRANRG